MTKRNYTTIANDSTMRGSKGSILEFHGKISYDAIEYWLILILASSQEGVLLAKEFLHRNMNVISLISFYKNVLGRDFNEPLLALFCFDVSFEGNSDAQ